MEPGVFALKEAHCPVWLSFAKLLFSSWTQFNWMQTKPLQTVCWLLTISDSLIPLAASQLYFGLHFSARDANLRTCCAIHRLGFWHVLEARRTFGMDVVGELEAERKSALKRTSSDSFWPRNERLLWLLERQNSSPTTSIPMLLANSKLDENRRWNE